MYAGFQGYVILKINAVQSISTPGELHDMREMRHKRMAQWISAVRRILGKCTIRRFMVACVWMGIVLPSAAIFLIFFTDTYRFFREELMKSQRMVLHEATFTMATTVDLINFSTTYVFLNDAIKNGLSTIAESDRDGVVIPVYEEIRKSITQIENSTLYPIGAKMVIVDQKGKLLTSETRIQLDNPIYEFAWYQHLLDAQGLPCWDARVGELWGMSEDAICSARVLYNARHEPLGIVAVFVPQNVFWAKIRSLQLDYRGNTYLIAKDGRIIASDVKTESEYLEPELLAELRQAEPFLDAGVWEFHLGYNDTGLLLPVGSTGFYLMNEVSVGMMLSGINRWFLVCFVWISVMFVVFIVFGFALAEGVSRPIRRMTETIRRIKEGERHLRMTSSGFRETRVLSASFNELYDMTQDLLVKVQRETELREQAHFEALRAQINPHFLFNTLNAIKWMAAINHDEKTADMIANLGRVLDHTLTRNQPMTNLKTELDILQAYIDILMMRYGNSFTYINEIDPALYSCQLPKFILQPIIENSIIHGLVHINHGFIRIWSKTDGTTLELYVQDNGIGMNQNVLDDILQGGSEKNPKMRLTGIGIRNVNDRLKIQYGPGYGLSVFSKKDQGFLAVLKIPLIRSSDSNEKEKDDAESADC